MSAALVSVELRFADKSLFGMKWPLAHLVVVPTCTYELSKYKLEILLIKAAAGRTWARLVRSPSDAEPAPEDADIARAALTSVSTTSELAAPRENVVVDRPPAYPSSSPTKKNWAEIDGKMQEELKDEDKADGPDALFKQLYSGADEDQRRAMAKSYSESGGTTLSMDWKDIGKKRGRDDYALESAKK